MHNQKSMNNFGYFKAILKTQGILASDTVVSSAGEKQGDIVKIVIEGDLP